MIKKVVYPEPYDDSQDQLINFGKYYQNRVVPWILALQNNGFSSQIIKE